MESIIIGSCDCGVCSPDHKDCDFLLSTLCKIDGIKDPNYMNNGYKNCPNFKTVCQETCNYCPSTSGEQTTTTLTTTRQTSVATATQATGKHWWLSQMHMLIYTHIRQFLDIILTSKF